VGLVFGHGAGDPVGEGLEGATALEGIVGFVFDAFAIGTVAVEAELLVNGFTGMVFETGRALCRRLRATEKEQGGEVGEEGVGEGSEHLARIRY